MGGFFSAEYGLKYTIFMVYLCVIYSSKITCYIEETELIYTYQKGKPPRNTKKETEKTS